MKFSEYIQETKRTLPDLDETYGEPPIEEETGELKGIAMQYLFPTMTLPKDILNTVHMRLGQVGEIHELMHAMHTGDKVNIVEEICDILWYTANDLNIKLKREAITKEVWTSFSNWRQTQTLEPTDGASLVSSQGALFWLHAVIYNISRLANLNKRDVAYEKPEPNEEYNKYVIYLLNAINNLAYELKIDLEDGMQKNIDKLRKRFPKKFVLWQALNRDLGAEREALEGGALGTKALETSKSEEESE